MSSGPFFMRRTPLEDDRYICSYCSQIYPSQRELRIHEYMHGDYVMEALFDLAVQPRISYMTYEFFTYECRGIESGVFGKELGSAETPEQDYEDEENVSYNGNGELLSTSQSLINKITASQQNHKFVSEPLMTNFTPANQQPIPSYTLRIPPSSTSYTPHIPPSSRSYTPLIQPLSPSYTPPIQPLSTSYTDQPTRNCGSIPLPNQHNADRCERPSIKLVKNTTSSEQIATTANADLTIKCQMSFLSPGDHENNPKTFNKEINS